MVSSAKVLHIEDNPGDRFLIAEMLVDSASAEFVLTQAATLAAGLSRLQAEIPDVILLDLALPDAHGKACFDQVVAAAPLTPVLILTGADDDALGMHLVKAGAQDFLPKQALSNGLLTRAIRYAIERKHLQEALYRLAWHDRLTDLPNRALLQERGEQMLAMARRNRSRVAVLFVDLDDFKQVNDSHGHDCGDALLRVVAARLRAAVRESDTVARLGGDEFVIVASQVRGRDDAQHIATKVHAHLREAVELGPIELPVAASIGAAIFPDDGDTFDALLKVADAMMYQIKRMG